MADIEQLIRQHEMGQAYIAITNQMGPDPQLVAFVNYDTHAGFEHLDMFSQHLEILDQIENDNSLELACEGLITKLLGFTKEPAPVKHSMSTSVPSYDEFKFLKEQYGIIAEYEKLVVAGIPSNATDEAWSAFEKTVSTKLHPALERALNQLKLSDKHGHNFSIEESGWTKDNYKEAHNWIEQATAHHHALIQEMTTKINSITHELKSVKPDSTVVKNINATLGKPPFGNSSLDLRDASKCVMEVASHFNDKE